MKLHEMFDKAIPGYQDLEDDASVNAMVEPRKTRLTLMQINKLRKLHDVRNFEQEQKQVTIRQQYGTPEETDDF